MGAFKGSLGSLGTIAGTVGGGLLAGPAGAVVGGSVLGALGTSYSQDYLSRQEMKRNIALWNMQNAYNTPAEQMKRFKEAGLNPNLIYGQTNTAGSVGSYSQKNVDHISPLLMAQMQQVDAQTQNALAQADSAYWQAGINQYAATRMNALARMAQYEADYAEEEHKLFKRTHKIPERYARTDVSSEVAGTVAALFRRYYTKE